MITYIQGEHFAVRIKEARARLFARLPFYGILMMNLRFALDDTVGTAATNGTHIIFDPSFSEDLDDRELDFVIMHELMHVALDHLARGKGRDQNIFNVACDIVVNSSIMKMLGTDSFTVAGEEVMHLTPIGSEGHLYSAEEVYSMLMNSEIYDSDEKLHTLDIHTRWSELTPARRQEIRRLVAETVAAMGKLSGGVPPGIERTVGEMGKPKLDWRQILASFVQEEVYDYSFTRPDNRYSGELIMPGMSAIDGEIKNVLFMIDTSGSMYESDITACFAEVCGAIEQFGGMLSGLLGFFDSDVTAPVPFESVKDVMAIKPIGGGGTSVDVVFNYVKEQMAQEPPVSIIILTDGYVYIPKESPVKDIPVLWVITESEEYVDNPKWGTVVRLETEHYDY